MAEADPFLLFVGLTRPFMWWAGAALAWYRKRWAVAAGMALAGVAAVVGAFTYAGAAVPKALGDTTTLLSTPMVALIVFGFVAAQPKRAGRPERWRP